MGKAISEIKKELETAPVLKREELYAIYEADERKGVQNIIIKCKKQDQAMLNELARLKEMHFYEEKYQQYSAICGIDEAGRGPLAGPVVAGACILPKDVEILYLNDSKKLSEKKRELLYDEITEKAAAWGVGIVSEQRIDEINILQATFEAMHLAVEQLKITPDLLLVDAVNIPHMSMKQVGIVKGDAKSVSIAAASILAKVTRDRMMVEYDQAYPEYGFAIHKGYGTKLHMAKLAEFGPSPIHRKTFIKGKRK